VSTQVANGAAVCAETLESIAKDISNIINAAVRNREVIICYAEGLKELA
jgi:hypothetical protein